MDTQKRSRWRDEDEDPEIRERLRAEKKKKKKLRQEKKAAAAAVGSEKDVSTSSAAEPTTSKAEATNATQSTATNLDLTADGLLKFKPRPIQSCRSVENYERLNHIDEGTYGVVFKGREMHTNQIFALKKLKLEKNSQGFPITSLREIRTLRAIEHQNVVRIEELVVGGSLDQIYIVMEYVDHDLRELMKAMREPFLQSEAKTLLRQLLSAVAYMHAHFIIHRDLKTSNLLITTAAVLKVADFGLARYYSDPVEKMTPLVVTLWYRAPELLLGAKEYSTEVDMWSVGCIFVELLTGKPLFDGKSEINQIKRIFDFLGYPDNNSWPGYSRLPHATTINPPKDRPPTPSLRSRFPFLTSAGVDLLSKLLQLDPKQRISAADALNHPYFSEDPKPKPTSEFLPFPSTSETRVHGDDSPGAPAVVHGGGADAEAGLMSDDDDEATRILLASPADNKNGLFREDTQGGAGFQLRFG
ncbi:kinase-like domain-containing protein [Myxozyma melibiosi]|uniref:Kinase-like domain-containing protein n=1 Tax=Myxozyma melibiosi TaxID=54550 RepID=A0ABR1F3H8_9ASCO